MITTRIAAAAVLAIAAMTAAGTGVANATPASPAVQPVASVQENHAAEEQFLTEFGIATAVGGFAGTATGAIIGCAVGGVVTSPTLVFVPAGCLAGAVPGAAIGGIVGTIAVGGPTLVVSGADLIQTLAAAPGTTKWVPVR
jgi:hypothetical protein